LKPLGILMGFAVLMVACGGGTDQTAMERELQTALAGELTPVEIKDVACPEDVELTPESVFLCGAEVESSYYEVQVTVIDAQGRFEYERRHAVLNVVTTELQLEADVTEALGFEVTTNCGDNEYLIVSVGNTFQCTLVRETGATRNVEVQVENADAVITWQLLPN